MNILVYGSKGWIGTQFCDVLLNKNIQHTKGKSRCGDYEGLEKEILEVNPTHIISFIGRTHGTIGDKKYTTIDYLEQEGKLTENIRDNLYSPVLLCSIAKKHDIHYTYLGTGCIFKYDDAHPFEKEENGFTEEAVPQFFRFRVFHCKGIY